LITDLLIVPILWSAVAFGSRINRIAGADPAGSLTIERRLFGMATGLVLLAYAILILGLLGLLVVWPILACCVIEAVVGWDEHARMLREITGAFGNGRLGVLQICAAAFFLVFAAAALFGCFTPPASVEWDSLSYHLADPKIYLANHRIVYLPWESHSNFAFTMEMLYTLGLSLHSIALAKLFHFSLGVAATVATYLIGRRIHSSTTGVIAALIFASLPLVFWEGGTAYVDLAATAFGGLATVALIAALQDESSNPAWLRISMIMMACMISVKATSLVPAALSAGGIVAVQYHQSKRLSESCRSAVNYGVGAVLLGSVWYLKAWIVAGNPFFPFGYSLFGGHYWSASNAAGYANSQSVFGVGHKPFDLLLAPWNLLLFLLPGNIPPAGATKPFNDFQTYFAALSPVFLATLFVPTLWNKQSGTAIRLLGLFGLLSLIIWFYLTQQVRYLLPTMPIYCVLAGYVLVEVWSVKSFTKYALAGLFALSLLTSAYLALMLVKQVAPVALGIVSWASYIEPALESYTSMQYINQNTPKESGVVCYGEPRDFYLDRRYMWGEPGHGLVIPYDTMHSSDDLRVWMLRHGYQYILIGSYAAIGPGQGVNGLVFGLTYGSGNQPLFQDKRVTVWCVV
jgi:hypothetical protein